jgi:hypothetical protein
MPTGDKQVNLFLNRLLDKTALKEQFLEFLSKKIDDGILSMTAGDSGTLDSDKVSLTASAVDTFDLDMSNARRLAVGGGQVITLPTNANRIVGEHLQISFENTTGQPYEVGVRYQSVKDGIAINGRTGQFEYPSQLETIGELGSPSGAVNDPGVKLTLKVDGLTQASIDHSGRLVRVYMTVPVSGVESIAYYDGVIAWVGGENVIEIPYSGGDGPLGQDTSVYPPSTTIADYQVHVKGASWKRGAATILGDNDYAFIGVITGNGPAATPISFNINSQVSVFLITLQKAYDGIGSGAGRRIQADDGAVKIESDDSNDELSALLHLNRRTATEANPVGLIALSEPGAGTTQINLVPLEFPTGSALQQDEPATSQAGVGDFNLTRGSVHLVNALIEDGCDLVLARNFTTPSMNGLWSIGSFTLNTINLSSEHGSVTWNATEGGTLTFLRPRLTISEGQAFNQLPGLCGGVVINGLNRPLSPNDDAALLIFNRQAAAALNVYDASTSPRLQTVITQDATVHLETSGNPEPFRNCMLRLSRFENTDWSQFMLFLEEGDVSSIPIAALKPINYPPDLPDDNNVTLSAASDLVTFTGAGIALNGVNAKLNTHLHLLMVYSAFDKSDIGLYGISNVTATTVQATEIMGGPIPSFVGGSAKARILAPTFVVGGASKLSTLLSFWNHSALFTCRDVDGNHANPIAIVPDLPTAADVLRFFNTRLPSLGAPEIASRFELKQTSVFNDLQAKWRHGGVLAGVPIHCGHEFNAHPGHEADDFAVNVRPGPARQLSNESLYNRCFGMFNEDEHEVLRLEHTGRIARVHEFFEDFQHDSAPASLWNVSTSGGTVSWGVDGDQGGILRAVAGTTGSNYARITHNNVMYMRHQNSAIFRVIYFAGRFRPLDSAAEVGYLQMDAMCYLAGTGSHKVGVRYKAAATGTQFEFFVTDGVTTYTTVGKGSPGPSADERGWFKFFMKLDLNSDQISVSWDHEETANSNGQDAMNFVNPTNVSWFGALNLSAEIVTQNVNTHGIEVDWLHVYDEVLQSGAKDRNS